MVAPLRWFGTALAVAGLTLTGLGVAPVLAAGSAVDLGSAASFGVLAGTTVTNTGPSTISGNLGVSPGTAITGFPPGTVTNGTMHSADSVAAQAQSDVTTAYNAAAGQTPTAAVTTDLGGQTLVAGVYSGGALALTGTLTLDAANDPNAVFVFQAASTLTTASNSAVALLRGANPCNIFWQVGSSATLGTNSVFAGSVLALTSISATTGAKINGRLLARNGATTLDTVAVASPACAALPPAPSATSTPTASGSPSATSAPSASSTPSATSSATAIPRPTATASRTATGRATASPISTPTATPTSTPATAGVKSGGGSPNAPATLPFTGAPVGGLLRSGLLILGFGLLLLLLSVPRPRRRPEA